MSLVDRVNDALKEAMKAKDKVRLGALRNVRAAFIEASKQPGVDAVDDASAVEIVRRLAKKHVESIASYEQGGRDDLVAEEREQLAVLEDFLPRLADEATTRAWATEAIAAVGAAGPGDMGKVMGRMMAEHKAELDGKLAQQVVRSLLTP
ncbi:MAG: GatB/YqeY domain-containing protein [Alphaproteobacteria bacterium]|nr:GatB/YqeY domain-containing protein [Alphaproteobacteria bacterium]